MKTRMLIGMVVPVLGSNNPRLPGDHSQYVGIGVAAVSGSKFLSGRGGGRLRVSCPVRGEDPSGLEPTGEPTGFEPVVVSVLHCCRNPS